MRKINDMMKLIPPDELNGGITMNSTKRTEDNESNISYSKSSEVKLKRGTSGLIAAALVLAVGGGALALALTRGNSVKSATSGAESITAAAQNEVSADKTAEKIFRLIDANCAAHIADGYLSEIARGSFTVDLAALDPAAENMFARSLGDKFTDEAKEYFRKITAGDTNIPETGEVFYVMNNNFKLEFVQYRSGKDGTVGQYSAESCERMAFGTAPDFEKKPEVPDEVINTNVKHAKAFYDLINRMQMDCTTGEYPNNLNMFMLPPGNGVILDFDDRGEYADVIYRIEQYNTENIELTGKVYFEVCYGNDLSFLEWRPKDGGNIEVWPYIDCSAVKELKELGQLPENSGYDQYSNYREQGVEKILGCGKYDLKKGGLCQGVTTEHDRLPQVKEWYEDFLSKNYQPVAFDSEKLISAEDLGKVVEFDWLDVERKQQVFIRTSDMEGANIYVNGRYYNVEDTSVLELLEGDMPPSVIDLHPTEAGK
ncbi:hypothetical protein SAMN02910317_02554 [Ruminococcaceae bacterium FB2012]|nr:hypothetical protein SAMN02910317_02554 [Ruminococcaceae bacterium FB2012]